MIPTKGSASSWVRWAIPVAVVAVLVVIAVVVGGSRSQAPRSDPFKARSQDPPVAPGQDGPEGDRLYNGIAVGPPPTIPEPVTLDDFMSTLEKTVPAPVARKVVAEFKKDPVLRQAADAYRKKRGGKAQAREFVDFITRIPQFRQLMARFSSDPGFKAAYSAAMKQPEIGAIVRTGTVGSRGAIGRSKAIKGGPGAQAVDAEAIAREWQRKALSGLDLSQVRSLGIGSTSLPNNMLAAAGISPIGIGGGVPATAGDFYSVTKNQGSDQSAHDATKLKNVKDITYSSKTADSTSWDSADWTKALLQSIGKGAAKKIRDYMVSCAESSGTGCSIWGACYATGNFAACSAQCGKTVEKCPQDFNNPFSACEQQIQYTQTGCIVECLDGNYGCQQGQINTGQWQAACSQRTLLRYQCLTSYKFGPCMPSPKGCKPVYGSLGADGTVVDDVVVADSTSTVGPPPSAPTSVCDADCVVKLIQEELAKATAATDAINQQLADLRKQNDELYAKIEEMKKENEALKAAAQQQQQQQQEQQEQEQQEQEQQQQQQEQGDDGGGSWWDKIVTGVRNWWGGLWGGGA